MKPELNHSALSMVVRGVIGIVLVVAIIFKATIPTVDSLSALAICADGALLLALIAGTVDGFANKVAAGGFFALALTSVVITLYYDRCGCFGTLEIPRFAPSVFAAAAGVFCVVSTLGQRINGLSGPQMRLLSYAAPLLASLWLAVGMGTAIAEPQRIRIDLLSHQLRGESLASTLMLAAPTTWDKPTAVLFVSSSCSTCHEVMQAVQKLGNQDWRGVVIVDVDAANQAIGPPFVRATSWRNAKIRMSTPAAAHIENGIVREVFLGRMDDVAGVVEFLAKAAASPDERIASSIGQQP